MGEASESNTGSPPLGLDALLDIVIGLPMSMSGREAQRDTGIRLRDAILSRLDEAGKHAPEAASFVDEVLPSLMAATRGMAVGRDLYASKAAYLTQREEDALAYLDSLAGLAPLNKDGWFFRLLPLLPVAAVAAAALKKYGVPTLLWAGIVGIVLVVSVDIVLKVIRWTMAGRARKNSQDESDRYWQAALNQYRAVLRDFLRSAVRTSERY